jgi:hypothetical protein
MDFGRSRVFSQCRIAAVKDFSGSIFQVRDVWFRKKRWTGSAMIFSLNLGRMNALMVMESYSE